MSQRIWLDVRLIQSYCIQSSFSVHREIGTPLSRTELSEENAGTGGEKIFYMLSIICWYYI